MRPEDGSEADIAAHFAAIVAHSHDAIVGCAGDGSIVSWNPAAERLFGYARDEIVGKPLTVLVPPERVQEIGASAVALSRGEAVSQLETVRLRKDGTTVDVGASISPIVDRAGAVSGLVAIYRDISERRQLASLTEARAALNALLAEMVTAIAAATAPKEALGACLRGLCALGRWQVGHVVTLRRGDGIEDLSLWHVADGVPADELVAVSETMDYASACPGFVGRALASGQPCWLEDLQAAALPERGAALRRAGLHSGLAVPVIVGGQTVALLEFFAVETRAADARLLEAMPAVMAQLVRAFERAAALRQLQDNEHQLRLIADHVPAMIAYFDTGLRCRYANRRYCDFYQIDPQRIRGMALREITGEAVYSLVRDTVAQAVSGKPVTLRRIQPGGVGGITHVEIRCVPDVTREEGLRGFYALLFDVTEQVRAEAAIRASEARLRAILDNEPACVQLLAADGELLEINRAGLALFEVDSLPALQARGLLAFVAPEFRERFAALLERTLAGERCALEFEIVGARGSRRWVETHTAPMPLADGAAQAMLAVTRDVTERKAAEARIAHLTYHDAVTDLPNRALVRERLQLATHRARRNQELIAVLVLEVDRFDEIGRELGHAAGDALLRATAARLSEQAREVDTIGRLDGGRFVVVVEGIASAARAAATAEDLLRLLRRPFSIEQQDVFVSASIGVSVYPDAGLTPDALLETAEIALARARHDGGDTYHCYEPTTAQQRGVRMSMEAQLRRALEHGRFVLHYQPRVCLTTGAITGAEALLRMAGDEFPLGPAQFISLAEETGLIVPIGEWALRSACEQAAAWHRAGHPLQIGVNLSVRQFRQRDLAARVAAAVAAAGIPVRALELEITESAAMADPDQAARILGELRELGVELSVDDFGTGYSSLSYLQRLPLQRLKIDRSFVSRIGAVGGSAAIVRAIIALARTLELNTTAEGVETEAQRDFLAANGCDQYQGFYFSPPVTAQQFEALLVGHEPNRTPGASLSCPRAMLDLGRR